MPPATTTQTSATNQVRKRSVFYLSGFDPKGAAHYHALYCDQAARQARVSGLQFEVGRRQKTAQGNDFWEITAQTPEGAVQTHYEFLRWDDIVREHWPRNQLRLLWDIVSTTGLNLWHGALWRMLKLAWPPVVALFAPFVLLWAVLLGAPLLAVLIFYAGAGLFGVWGAAMLVGIAVAGVVQLGCWLEKKYSMFWLMRSYAFNARQAQGRVPELDARLNQHAATLAKRIAGAEDDEVLLVGHSSGAMMAASVLAQALRRDPLLGGRGPVVSLLTLGQCMPMLACLPQACGFRDDLRLLAIAQEIHWIDFTAPPDGCCFALVDPLTACGISEAPRLDDQPKLLSPRFAEMFEPADYAAIRRDKFRVHFQYLMASDKPANFDYFAVTAGATTLAARFATDRSISNYRKFQFFSPRQRRPRGRRHLPGAQ